MDLITLNNWIEIPSLWIWTFSLTPENTENSVREALKMWYRLIDTANIYLNEKAVWKWIKESWVDRKDIFVSTKIWPTNYGDLNVIEETLENLGLDYIDLLFLHQPCWNYEVWYKQLEKAYKEWKIRSIGLSNFEWKFLDKILSICKIKPQIVQLETHPYCTQKELRKTLDHHNIKLMSWFPLWHWDYNLINESVFKELWDKYGKTPVQIILRWHIQMWFIVIPGSRNVEHIKDNFNIFDFEISKSDMDKIALLDIDKKYCIRTDETLSQYASMSYECWHDIQKRNMEKLRSKI